MNRLPTVSFRPLAAILLAGCGFLSSCSEAPPPDPVATVEAELARTELPYPEWSSLRLRWLPTAPLDVEGQPFEGEPAVFLHLLDSDGELQRTFDHPLPGSWQVGEEIQYEAELYQSALGPPLPPGEYELVLGLYGKDRRWALAIEGAEERPRLEYSVARITVPAVGVEGPAFEFPPAWEGVEAGNDRQILGRRWLEANGVLQVLDLEVPGTVKLQVTVPPGSGSADGWELRRETEPPTLEIASTCSGVVRKVEVPGTFDVELPVFPADEDLSCELHFLADYQLVQPSTRRERILILENLSWTPAEL